MKKILLYLVFLSALIVVFGGCTPKSESQTIDFIEVFKITGKNHQEQIDELTREVLKVLEEVPSVIEVSAGVQYTYPNINLDEYAYAIVVKFEDVKGLKEFHRNTYLMSVVSKYLDTLITDRTEIVLLSETVKR
jgi:hypothetical protein